VVRTSIECGCGRVHTDSSKLTKVGWQPDGAGGAALLVNCVCQSTLVAERMADACLCMTCRRLVTGADGDVKTCAWGDCGPIVLCGACFRRDPRRAAWLQWHECFVRDEYGPGADDVRDEPVRVGARGK
jgi:hypothetical protein